MTIITSLLGGLIVGTIFGFALEKSRVFEPGIIIGQFQLRNFIMLKVFLTAIMTSTIIFSMFFYLGFERLNWKVAIYGADIIGGLLLGCGIALAGGCPGTLFAQLGAGYKDSIATLCGGILGAFTFIQIRPWLAEVLLKGFPNQKITLDALLNLSFEATACILIIVFALILIALEWYRPWSKDIGENFDGLNKNT